MQAARALAKRYRTKLNLRAQLTAASLLVLFLQRELGDLLLSLSISFSLSHSLCQLASYLGEWQLSSLLLLWLLLLLLEHLSQWQ